MFLGNDQGCYEFIYLNRIPLIKPEYLLPGLCLSHRRIVGLGAGLVD